jgi:hypothetical protein
VVLPANMSERKPSKKVSNEGKQRRRSTGGAGEEAGSGHGVEETSEVNCVASAVVTHRTEPKGGENLDKALESRPSHRGPTRAHSSPDQVGGFVMDVVGVWPGEVSEVWGEG